MKAKEATAFCATTSWHVLYYTTTICTVEMILVWLHDSAKTGAQMQILSVTINVLSDVKQQLALLLLFFNNTIVLPDLVEKIIRTNHNPPFDTINCRNEVVRLESVFSQSSDFCLPKPWLERFTQFDKCWFVFPCFQGPHHAVQMPPEAAEVWWFSGSPLVCQV